MQGKIPKHVQAYQREGEGLWYADTIVSLFARASNICCGHKMCVQDTKMFLIFFQKHFVLCRARLLTQETLLETVCPQQCVLVCQGLYKLAWLLFTRVKARARFTDCKPMCVEREL